MSYSFIKISKDSLSLCLAVPGTYYKGTRFDWTGVFRSIVKNGCAIAEQWFDSEDAFRHDNVCGPSEEFAPVWVDDTHCVKIGVGILSVPEGRDAYDRFKLYDIVDPGCFEIVRSGDSLIFKHMLEGWYEYEKTVALVDDCAFRIGHDLKWHGDAPVASDCYNHNFFTMCQAYVGPSRRVVFDEAPSGHWRPDSVSGCIEGRELHFSRQMQGGEKCFIGDLHVPELRSEPYHFRVCEGVSSVDVSCDAPMDHAVFWSNHRVACVEPYVVFTLGRGESFRWNIYYKIEL